MSSRSLTFVDQLIKSVKECNFDKLFGKALIIASPEIRVESKECCVARINRQKVNWVNILFSVLSRDFPCLLAAFCLLRTLCVFQPKSNLTQRRKPKYPPFPFSIQCISTSSFQQVECLGRVLKHVSSSHSQATASVCPV